MKTHVKKMSAPAARAILPQDKIALAALSQLLSPETAEVITPTETLLRIESRAVQIMRSFLQDVNWDMLEEDLEHLRELHIVVSRRTEDETSLALGRVVETLEDMVDTAESCNLKS